MDDEVVAFETNVITGTSNLGSEFITILIGQLNLKKDFFVPSGIGREIMLFTIKDENGDIVNFNK